MTLSRFAFPTQIVFGPGARRELPAALERLGVVRPLLVTDRGVSTLGFFAELRELSGGQEEAAVFDDFEGNPLHQHVAAGVEAYAAHRADGVVAIGGGAPLDVAKAIALMVNHPGHLFDYEDGKPDARPVDQPVPPIVALPTTSGTGSEVGRSSVIGDDETHAKKIIFDPKLLPQVVLADPELTVGLPKGVTAATGMDALTHSIEAYLSVGYHPMADGIALEAVRMIAGALPRVVEDGTDLEARGEMLMASMMGAVAFQKGLGITHSLAHPLSTVCDLHHGLSNALMLPHAMAFNAEVVPEKLARLAEVVGAPRADAQGFIAWLTELNEKLGLPTRLGEVGVEEGAHLEELVRYAETDVCWSCNPRTPSADDFRQLYRRAF